MKSFKLDKDIEYIKYLYFELKYTYKQIGNKYGCSLHPIYHLFKKYKIKARNQSEAQYKNAKTINSKGYINITPMGNDKKFSDTKNGVMKEHRLVMAKHLNRKLYKHEQVHHINGNKQDNRIENLELWSISQPSGQRVKDKIKWAKHILKEYKDYKL